MQRLCMPVDTPAFRPPTFELPTINFPGFPLFPILRHQIVRQMAENKKTPTIFSKDNYLWMLAGVAVIAIGMFLMSGGASSDPSVFNEEEVYSTRRITVAPILILAGLVIEIYAIFKRPKPEEA